MSLQQRGLDRVERGQSSTPGVWAEKLSKAADIYRIRWAAAVGVNGVGGSTGEVTNPKTGERVSLREARYVGKSAGAIRARAQACQWVADDLERRRGLRAEGETLASRSIDSLTRLCNAADAVDVDPRVVGRVLGYSLILNDPTGTVAESRAALLALCVEHAWTPSIRSLARSATDLPALAEELVSQPKRKRGSVSWQRMGEHIRNHQRFISWCEKAAIWRDDYGSKRVGHLTSPRYLDRDVLEQYAATMKTGTRIAVSTRTVDLITLKQWLTRLEARERPRLSDQAIKDALPRPKKQLGKGAATTRRDGGSPIMYTPAQLRSILLAGLKLDEDRERTYFDPTCTRVWLGRCTALQLLFWACFGSRACETRADDLEDRAVEIGESRVTLVTAKTGKVRHLLSAYAPNTFQAIKAQREFDAALRAAGFREDQQYIYAPSKHVLGASDRTIEAADELLIERGAPATGPERFTPKSLRSSVASYLCVSTGITNGAGASVELAAAVLGNTYQTVAQSYMADHIRPILIDEGVNFAARDIEQLMQIDDLAREVRDRIRRRITRIPEVIAVNEERKRIRHARRLAKQNEARRVLRAQRREES